DGFLHGEQLGSVTAAPPRGGWVSCMRDAEGVVGWLREQHRRVTPQRRRILEVLEQDQGHLTVEAIYEGVRSRMPTVSLKTVYQNLHELEALGVLRLVE